MEVSNGKTLNGKFSAACPLCGDPSAYALWVDDRAPEGCGQSFDKNGRPIEVKTVADCHFAMAKAAQQALMRRLKPECFDETGAMLPGRLAEVLLALPEGTVLVI